ncbi:MAG TPA: leucine--tRNA ligase [Chitinophagaceae bacterium]|nr:MAG: leucyl-tRNA synthetase [Bacteroidetes bacterium OLB11]HMN33581.1 leucine--tRNA ligase [Chitinophagaceae bacterium]
MQYHFREIEKKWQSFWNQNKSYEVKNDFNKPKCYVLDMFPYPSGSGLHVGHPLGYIASDIFARYKKLKGFNVLHPMGFDAFGLPAEQYAIETGQHPSITTEQNINRYKQQLRNIGFCYDTCREVNTSDPHYYKWTQWIFLKLYNSWFNHATQKAEPIESLKTKMIEQNPEWSSVEIENELMKYRLAYRAESYVNWCEALGTVLANDEVINGVSERGGHPVDRKKMSQWFLRITDYADRLLEGLEKVQFPESLKEMQRNWIGKSVGAEMNFEIENSNKKIKVFTTRPDTIFGVSFLVLAPEHELVSELTTSSEKEKIEHYKSYVTSRSERERLAENKKVTGCFTGSYAIHPFTKNKIPIWIAEYVLAGYGTGAIMAVPAGDERDFHFAQHFQLPIPIIFKGQEEQTVNSEKNIELINSDFLNDFNSFDASKMVIQKLEDEGIGKKKINYRMRDAGFSRQRYWGEPFPVYYDENNTPQALLENDLPLLLPFMQSYSAGPNGKGPLANNQEWVNIPQGTRETDTMPGYAGSSWYYLRYMDPHNDKEFCDRTISDYWNQVDVYIGGAEHAVGHLLYSRMWCKVLYDLGYISFDEPYKKLINQGMIQGSSRLMYRIKQSNTFVSSGLKNQYETDEIYVDCNFCDGVQLDIEKFKAWRTDFQNATFILENGKYYCGAQVEKMSKRLYNIVNPDDVIEEFGADTFRMYEMFLGPIEMSKPWDTKGIEGVHRFLKKLWRIFIDEQNGLSISNEKPTNEEFAILHHTIKKVTNDIENFALNTAVSQFMICVNDLQKQQCNKREILEPLLILLTPFAPHICEELWHLMGNTHSILDAKYPEVNEEYLQKNQFTYPIAINGKTRTELNFAVDLPQNEIEQNVLADEVVQKWLEGKSPKKIIFVKGRMINVVI